MANFSICACQHLRLSDLGTLLGFVPVSTHAQATWYTSRICAPGTNTNLYFRIQPHQFYERHSLMPNQGALATAPRERCWPACTGQPSGIVGDIASVTCRRFRHFAKLCGAGADDGWDAEDKEGLSEHKCSSVVCTRKLIQLPVPHACRTSPRWKSS